ncbi:aryl sulfotransferase [Campylobacter sp. faydin G-140]|uniref:aryl sulfotransferase n=1 Tax=Campylobacter anatolicus TaxID=2829105 RepID=UPI001B90E305|nr:aryl sulfotransferase [Campylobacter anatolicus]MBR8462042.1 aryl sulfotransferase [Campylobacter anatolicus]MBR8464871.1 aryl sulfotransferase [Campylobacter anatolicus]
MKRVFGLVTALFSAFAATLCCLPALLFLLFGTSFSFLSWMNSLYEYRTFLSVLAVISFVLSAFFVLVYPKSCVVGSGRRKWILIYIMSAFLIVILLAYPEILGRFYA